MLGVLLLVCSASGYAQIDPTIARVRLTRVEVVTQKQFKQQIERLEAQLRQPLSAVQRRQILDALVDEKILLQAAERANVRVNDSEIERALDAYKQDFARQLRRTAPLTDAELRELLKQQGTSFDHFQEQVANRLTVDKLITVEEKPLLQTSSAPSPEQVSDYYESNRTRYPIVSPEMVRFKQILLVTTGMGASDTQTAKVKADEIYRAIQNGEPFDKFQEVFLSAGQSSKIGGLSFETWRRDDEQKRVTFGRDFFESLFSLEAGKRSAVVKSNVGFHIVEVIERVPFGVLGLDDKIPPQNATTVRGYITSVLTQRSRAEVVQKATQSLITRLRDEAEVRIDENALTW